MDDMKGIHRFTDIFWKDQLVDDIRLHWFTPSRHLQKQMLWKRLCIMYVVGGNLFVGSGRHLGR